MSLEIGRIAPNFTLLSDAGKEVSLSDFKGKSVILYFYPKDNTPGCTIEARDFTAAMEDFAKKGYVILGVSRDSVAKHCNFKEKQDLTITLLADTDEVACKEYDVLKEKNLYGKKSIGIERSTFVINGEGIITHIFRGVNAKVHVAELRELLSV